MRVGERDAFLEAFEGSRDVDDFVAAWWRPLDPRELLLGLADTEYAYEVSRGVLEQEEAAALAASYRDALAHGPWSVAAAALVAGVTARLAAVASPATRTRVTVQQKNTSRAAVRAKARALARVVNAFQGTTDAQRAQLGLNVRDAEPTRPY